MVDTAIKNLACAWASMDGKPFDDDEYREGYIADATELFARSGIAAERAALRAELDTAEAKTLATVKRALEAAAKVAQEGPPLDHFSKNWEAIRALDPAQFIQARDDD